MKPLLAMTLVVSAFAEEVTPPQFTEAQKLTIARAALRAAVAETQARQAAEQANQLIANAKTESDKYAALVSKMLAELKAAGCSVDLQQSVVCPAK